jgi:hypothetical protein
MQAGSTLELGLARKAGQRKPNITTLREIPYSSFPVRPPRQGATAFLHVLGGERARFVAPDAEHLRNASSAPRLERPSTKVLLFCFVEGAIKLPAMVQGDRCDLLDQLQREAVEAILAAKQMRRSRDVSLYEDSELCRDQRRKIDAFISHLLAGHEGKPCPCGERPIVRDRFSGGPRLLKMEPPARLLRSSQKN